MNLSGWALAVVACLREKQFWRETASETFYLLTDSSSGLGIALTAAVLQAGHRVLSIACTMAPLQEPVNLYKL